MYSPMKTNVCEYAIMVIAQNIASRAVHSPVFTEYTISRVIIRRVWLRPCILVALNKKTMDIAIIASIDAAVTRYITPVARFVPDKSSAGVVDFLKAHWKYVIPATVSRTMHATKKSGRMTLLPLNLQILCKKNNWTGTETPIVKNPCRMTSLLIWNIGPKSPKCLINVEYSNEKIRP